jgi:hypothetical protein
MYNIVESINTWLLGKSGLWGCCIELMLCYWAVQKISAVSCFEIFESLLTIKLTITICLLLCILNFIRVGMIRMSLAHMKVFWSGNTRRWTLLIFTLRLFKYFTLSSEINLLHVVLTNSIVVWWQVGAGDRPLLFLFERGKRKLMEGNAVIFKGCGTLLFIVV